ncbi:MAG TPA: hypothetical protein VGV93_11150 [Acidimicrobiales bacterium]|nr:hypothetical protein [Acidimicrobiales bacterium]
MAGWKDRTTPQVVSITDPTSPAAEAYRSLRTSVQFIGLDANLGVALPNRASGSSWSLVTCVVPASTSSSV